MTGASASADRAVVNGAASVSAVPASVPSAETLVENLARVIALHGLGTVSGVDRQTPPSAEWDPNEYRSRILEVIPGAAEAKCRALASDILNAIFAVSNDREMDDGIRSTPGYAAEILRKKDPGMVGLILNLDRLQDVLDAMAAREVCAACGGDCSAANPPVLNCPAQAMSAGTAKTEGLGGDSPASAVVEDHAPETEVPHG